MLKTRCVLPVVGLLLGALALSPTASAQTAKGVLVRLETRGRVLAAPVVVHLAPVDGGDTLDLTLSDDGTSPDVNANDGIYAGASMVDADAFAVSVTIDGAELSGGEVAWDAEGQNARDLVIRLDGDQLTVSAGAATGTTTPTQGSALGAPSGTVPTTPVTGPTVDGGPAPVLAPTGSPAGGGQQDALLWVALGLGLIGLAVAGFLLSRWVVASPKVDLPIVPEPPLLGPGTPSLTDGLSVWKVAPDQHGALLRPLLATLARHHRVLFVAPPAVEAPRVFGGPVYRAPSTRLDDVEDALQSLAETEGAPVALLALLGPDQAGAVDELGSALPDHVGGIAIVSGDVETTLARLSLVVEGDQVVVESADGRTRLHVTERGFEATETA